MTSVEEIIALLGGPTELGRICGFTRHPGARGSDMKSRGSIPVDYWPAIIAAAQERGIAGITHQVLTDLHAAVRASRKGAA